MQSNRAKRKVVWLLLAAVVMIALDLAGLATSREIGTAAIEAMSWLVAGQRFIVDPGHGGEDPGKVSPAGIYEKDINLAVAKKLALLLSQGGAEVILTREDDKSLSNNEDTIRARKRADLAKRAELAAAVEADLFISLHCNSFPGGRWRGAQTFYAPANAGSQKLAEAIQDELVAYLGNTSRKPKLDSASFLLKQVGIPIVNVEIGFLSNPVEEKLLQESSYQDKVAWSVYAGIVRFLAEGQNNAGHTLKGTIK